MKSSIRNLPSPLSTILKHDIVVGTNSGSDDSKELGRLPQFLCSKAIGIGSTIYGIQRNDSRDGDAGNTISGRNDTFSISWKQPFPFYNNDDINDNSIRGSTRTTPGTQNGFITALSLNTNGTIMAIASNHDIISLLRTSDGTVIHTYPIYPYRHHNQNNNYDEDRFRSLMPSSTIRFTWLDNCDGSSDVLFIEVVSSLSDSVGGRTDEDYYDSGDSELLLVMTNIILPQQQQHMKNHTPIQVHTIHLDQNSHISHATKVNSTTTTAATATKCEIRAITAVRVPSTVSCTNHSSSTDVIIRFIVCDCDHQLIVFDYAIVQEILVTADSNGKDRDHHHLQHTSEKIQFIRQHPPIPITTIMGAGNCIGSMKDVIPFQAMNSTAADSSTSTSTYSMDYEFGFAIQRQHHRYHQHNPTTTLSKSQNMRIDPSTYIVCSAFLLPHQPILVWLPPQSSVLGNGTTTCLLQTECVFPIPSIQQPHQISKSTSSCSRKVIAMETMSSWNDQEVIATAIAVKTTNHNTNSKSDTTGAKVGTTSLSNSTRSIVTTTIYIVQVVLATNATSPTSTNDDESSSPMKRLYHPHLLYTIPIDELVQSLSIVPMMDITNSTNNDVDERPYSFLYQIEQPSTDSGTNTVVDKYLYKLFQPEDSVISTGIGKIRSLMRTHRYDTKSSIQEQRNEMYDAAERIVSCIGPIQLIMEPYIHFHPMEIVYNRFAHTLQQTPALLMEEEIHLCLRQLAHAVILPINTNTSCCTSVQHADIQQRTFTLFVQAIEMIQDHISSMSSSDMATISIYQLILSHVVSVVQNILPSISHSVQSERLHYLDRSILEQISVFQVLSSFSNPPKTQIRYSDIRSLDHLYEVCIQEHQFVVAERVYRSTCKARCWTIPTLVNPLLSSVTGTDVPPKDYMLILQDVIFPNLSINDRLLPRILRWSCIIADQLDAVNTTDRDLNAAYLLLRTMDAEIRKLQLQIHGSFAHYSPFTDSYIDNEVRFRSSLSRRSSFHVTESEDNDASISNRPFASAVKLSASGKKRYIPGSATSSLDQPIPTILQRNVFHRGPTNGKSFAANASDGCDDFLQEKLLHTQCLLEARQLGLQRNAVLLENFIPFGGAQRLAKELVRLLSASPATHEERRELLKRQFESFCTRYSVEHDLALRDYIFDRCRGEGGNVTMCTMTECCSIARCCHSLSTRCESTLLILRAALFCERICSSIFQLSKEAIDLWVSSETSIKSEIQEALRLLQINDVVMRYCGAGARELFRVGNPLHSTRLLEFVTRHIDHETVIDDALLLCDAFNHLSPFQATKMIVENAIESTDHHLCQMLFEKLIKKNARLAENALVQSVLYSDEILAECSEIIRNCGNMDQKKQCKEKSQIVAGRIHGLLQIATKYSLNVSCDHILPFHEMSLTTLQYTFLRIQRLQRDHSSYISMREMMKPMNIVDRILPLLEEVAGAYSTLDSSSVYDKLGNARTVCSLISMLSTDESRQIWVTASTIAAVSMSKGANFEYVHDFLSDTNILQDAHDSLTALCHMRVSGAQFEIAAHTRDNAAIAIRPMLNSLSILSNWSIFSLTADDLVNVLGMRSSLEIGSMILSRCDEGVGDSIDHLRLKLQRSIWQRKQKSDCSQTIETKAHKPGIHSSWYYGDGILLEPSETFHTTARFCTYLLRKQQLSQEGIRNLYDMLIHRGAQSLALRVISEIASISVCYAGQTCKIVNESFLQDSLEEIIFSLAERNLGGTGTGITSSVVDFEQAAIFILLLPIKRSFVAYKSCVATAMKTQNFDRVRTLANVGKVTSCEDCTASSNVIFSIGWRKQRKFFDQCQYLATNALWWSILQFVGVEFDPNLFGALTSVEVSGTPLTNYATALLPTILSKGSKSLGTSNVLRLANEYSNAFNVPKSVAAKESVEFLLDPKNITTMGLLCPDHFENSIRRSLEVLTPTSRCNVLRRCLRQLENADSFSGDYEWFNLTLSLYHEALLFLTSFDSKTKAALIETELETIERRRDVLSIITAFFQGDRWKSRPRFSSFFVPLSDSMGHVTVAVFVGILGNNSNSAVDAFDPLAPIEDVLSLVHETDVVTALAPLCIPLDLPTGFVHARSLMTRFKQAKALSGAYPSFEDELTPIFNKIVSPLDRAVLAEWCTNQYDRCDQYKLKCLTAFLNAAIEASIVIEKRRSHFPNDKMLKQQELDYLNKIRLLTSTKSSLSDMLNVKSLLQASALPAPNAVANIIYNLISELDDRMNEYPEMSPESLVDFLLTAASRLTSEACLYGESSFPVHYLRQCCSIVQAPCHAIADLYSHVDVSDRARRIAHRWLFYGDDCFLTSSPTNGLDNVRDKAFTPLDMISEEATTNFVMDLSVLQQTENDIGKYPVKSNVDALEDKGTVSVEEPSSLRECSGREYSESLTQRSALKIAFILSISTHKYTEIMKENRNSNEQHVVNPSNKRLGLLAQINTKKEPREEASLYALGLELLKIVFAKSCSLSAPKRLHLNDSASFITDHPSVDKSIPTVTFAMRHRALRVASILCPQDVLKEIIRDEGFLGLNDSLSQCSFAAYLVKEIEELGLPLPHSELVQLSSMHFLSYARSLWRDHRDDAILDNSKGRFYLLLIELCLHNDQTDPIFVCQLLTEMTQRSLPRSLLLALDGLVRYQTRIVESPFIGDFQETIMKAVVSANDLIFSELGYSLRTSTESEIQIVDVLKTLDRLYFVTISLLKGHGALVQFQKFSALLSAVESTALIQSIIAKTSYYQLRAERQLGIG